MAEFKLDRFKFRWRGDWQASTDYRRDDIVKVNGKSYVCLIAHTSDALFRTDLLATLPGSSPPQPQPKWAAMTSGKKFVGVWNTGTVYEKGDIVENEGSLFECVNSHTSVTFSTDAINLQTTIISDDINWTPFALHIKFSNGWASSTDYSLGQIIKYGGNLYKCEVPHTATDFNTDINNWSVFYDGYIYRSNWLPSIEYRKDEIVKYGGSVWRCKEEHTSSAPELDNTKFEIELPGSQHEQEWNSSTVYNIGDIVRYGGYLYLAIANNLDSDPSGVSGDSSNNWEVLAKSYNFRGTWSIDNKYRTGDIVQRGGELFIALTDIGYGNLDGSSSDALDTNIWERLAPGKIYSRTWQSNTLYSVGEVVYYFGNAYTCNFEHISENDNFPGDAGNNYTYWDLLIQGQPSALLYKGDLITYGNTRENVGDTSTQGDVRLGIGSSPQKLSVSEDLEVFWRNIINDSDTIFVSTNGSDQPGYGTYKDSPFRTVRHACEYVEDNFDPLTPVKIYVSTGRYEEVGPIAIPAGCVVMGDELRSTTIVATGPKTEYQNDYTRHTAGINHIVSIIFNVVNDIAIEKQPGNTLEQNYNNKAVSSAAVQNLANNTIDYRNYIEFRINSGSIDPTMTGSNTINSDINFINLNDSILLNSRFLATDAWAYLVATYPNDTFDKNRVINDYENLLKGLARDSKFSGNYKTLVSARRYSNSVLGSKNDDLFWVRDTTGLRNCTTDGLTGTLNPPGVFAQYQRPTGGACVALDPGWGPADERVWINNRSPYIQGVTNLGTACVGKKIDGALHNGGNRSMVSNDFTQVLSDGIGAWVLNNARAELVSVFTYYCQVGYLAENGGIIRATNGNNSYGTFGSIAEGRDETEIPVNITVNNRVNEAQIESALAGNTNDEFLIFEYSHCGENYTQATPEIIGAGADASVAFTDFRDGALSQARLINSTGSGSEGGSNYLVRQSSAQVTADSTSSIILSTNDQTQFESEILGMRIIIVAGQGAGQYAYVAGYNGGSKTVTVRRESDGELGWDHVIPGTPIRTSLDSTATYRIEARMTCNHPGYSVTSGNLPSARTIIDADFGGTYASYPNLEATNGTGDTFDADPINARFNVLREGNRYTTTLANPGAGYAIGDTIVFAGNILGGATPANDLTITITDVSDDSTSQILDFTTSGVGREERYIAIADPNFIIYSDDGDTWTEANTSFVSTFKRIIAGNNRFIALPTNENRISFSYTGESWTTRSLPGTDTWYDGVYGEKFVVIAENSNAVAYSGDGLSWSSATLPTGDDSTGDQWQAIAYGQQTYVVISGSQTKDVATSTNGVNWTMQNNVLPAGDYNWIKLVYGNNKFIALSENGETAYSLDKGKTWYLGSTLPSIDGSTAMAWKDMKYGQGVFFAICDTGGKEFGEDLQGNPIGPTLGPTTHVVTSDDGINWTARDLSTEKYWSAITFGSISGQGRWIALASNDANGSINKIATGARAKVRANIVTGSFVNVKIWDPGSGYTDANPVVITIVDNQFVSELETDNKIGNGVIAQPDFLNRGVGYKTTSSTITITGDGFAEIVPEENTVVLDGVTTIPGPGVQIRFSSLEDTDTADPDDLLLFIGVSATDLGDDGSGNGTRTVRFTISPSLKNEYNLAHGTTGTLITRYSQCRISGHDFLDIGTGNFEQTNYPDIYAGGAFFTYAPENEVLEVLGGKVFYVSTDQDGNFRAGELFGVNQATGIVTISAEFFDLDGLSEISLGGVRLGGSGTVVNEFSTDPTFSADSNNIVPTQKAIATFLANQLSVGGQDLETNNIIAGQVSVGTVDNIITTTGDLTLNFPRQMIFDGQDLLGNPTAIQGSIIAQNLFTRTFNDTIQ